MIPQSMTPPTPPGLPPQMLPPQMPPPPPAAQPAAKSEVLKWVLIAIAGVVVLCVLVGGLGSYFIYRVVKNAGFDPDLMRRNPGLAMTRMMSALHPDLEVVTTDENS